MTTRRRWGTPRDNPDVTSRCGFPMGLPMCLHDVPLDVVSPASRCCFPIGLPCGFPMWRYQYGLLLSGLCWAGRDPRGSPRARAAKLQRAPPSDRKSEGVGVFLMGFTAAYGGTPPIVNRRGSFLSRDPGPRSAALSRRAVSFPASRCGMCPQCLPTSLRCASRCPPDVASRCGLPMCLHDCPPFSEPPHAPRN